MTGGADSACHARFRHICPTSDVIPITITNATADIGALRIVIANHHVESKNTAIVPVVTTPTMPSHSTSSKTWVFGRVLSHLCVSICTYVLASASVFALRYYLIRGPTMPTSAPANNDRAPARKSRPAAQPPVGHHRVGSATYSHGSKIIITLQKAKTKVHEHQHHTYWYRQTASPSLARDRISQ